MKRAIVGFCLGVIAVLLGVKLALDAHSMATTWQSISPIVRSGTTDTNQETVYRVLGFALLGFGLVVDAMALNHWMGGRDLGDS